MREALHIVCLIGSMLAFTSPTEAQFTNPEPVAIEGYDGHAMEPFLARDDSILLFNNSNDPSVNTDLHWAERVSATRFKYRGLVAGTNTGALEGVPSMDRSGLLYFVSTRSYQQTLATIYRATFEKGRATDIKVVEGLSRKTLGQLNFDAEISADGSFIYAVDGTFDGGHIPKAADIFVARRVGERFERLPNSAEIMAKVNTSALEYAPAISADGLELFFTRMSGALFWRKLAIMHARRNSVTEPFGDPVVIEAISGFVEAPTISSDGLSLYYHSKVDGVYRIFRVTRPRR